MKAAITGVSGFLGKNLNSYLSREGVSIYPFSLRGNWLPSMPRSCDVVIHLAGKAHDTKNVSEASEYFRVNTNLTVQLFDAFLQSGARSFIYISSVKAAADCVEDVLTEETIPNPQTPYGESKLKAEEYLLNKVLPDYKRIYILRPCMIHGPGNKGNLNLIYQIGKRGIPYPLAKFENKRSFVSVENLCFVIDRFLKNDYPSGIYNVADDVPMSTTEIMSIIYEEHGYKNKLWETPKWMINFAARIGDILHLPLDSERLKKLTENYVVSNTKLIQTMGANLPIDAREGMKRTIHSFKAEGS
ncbi:NAD-dependent epimerase/dehydratase family protein [Parapedobacter sp. 2B3]|uniref:NAD-dependent epimerase/dehydratase family protein n=1 Tax=Parapedobacter sp. 2B3 TaxID=3342381 RepID=UPI0035B6339B